MKNKKLIIIIVLAIILIVVGSIIGNNVYQDHKEKEEKEKITQELLYLFENDAIVPDDDIYSIQAQTDAKINTAIENKEYTLNNPFVLVNPYQISPLTAIIIFQSETSDAVTLEVNNQKYTFEKNTKHVIPVYGLIAGKVNTIKITCNNKTKEIDLDMSDVSDSLNLDIEVGKGINLGSEIYIVSTPSSAGMFGFNTNGELVWRLTESFGLAITELPNGHLLLADSENMSINYSKKGLVEIDYLGKIYNVYDIEGGYHHASIVMENGNYIIGTSDISTNTNTDYIIEINPTTGKVVNKWSLVEIINSVSKNFVESLNTETWGFNNSIYYDANTNSLILSLRGRNSIISIGYDSKKLNWILGDPKYWNDDFKDYMITLENGSYPLGSHSAAINSDGNLVLFNNNYDASNSDNAICSKYMNSYSSGDIYQIEGKTAKLVSKFTDDDSFFSYAVSNYYEEQNGNYILLSGWSIPTNNLSTSPACTLNQINDGIKSIIYELDKNQEILFKASMEFGTYRAGKVNLYQSANANFYPDKINYFSTLNEQIYNEVETKDILNNLKNADSMEFSVTLSKSLLSINANFQLDEKVEILLVGETGKSYKYTAKEVGGNLQTTVNLKGITGKYAMFIIINDEYFNLNTVYAL